MALVVDASVALKWYVDEDGADEAEAILAGPDLLCAPNLILFEVGNALRKHVLRGTMTAAYAMRSVRSLGRAIRDPQPLSRLASRALELSLELGHPIYDCAYIALALDMRHARLATADRRLASLAERTGIPVVAL
ncbi:type II toxin-antitoxin system VapC family toxin [Salinarimonas sp. NSM]|uniref:type II toxin-antitoxin system VapC family toxin n=1 Tax=Salinarimonas sp. NSM TaxID=3458003 RepID=UPI0040361B2B